MISSQAKEINNYLQASRYRRWYDGIVKFRRYIRQAWLMVALLGFTSILLVLLIN